MDEVNRSKQPWFFGVIGILTVGLVSFLVWILRLIPKPVKRKLSADRSVNQFQVEMDAGISPMESPTATVLPSAKGLDADLTSAETTARQPGTVSQPEPVSPDTVVDKANPWTTPTRYIAGVGILLFLLWLISYSRQTLTVLIFAALIAILVRPFIHFLQKRLRFSQGMAVIVVYLSVAVLVFALPILIIPNVIHAINSLQGYDWQELLNGIAETLDNLSTQVAAIPLIGPDLANSLTSLAIAAPNLVAAPPATSVGEVPITVILSDLGEKVGLLGGLIGPIAGGIVSLVFMILISLQMSLAGGEIKDWGLQLFPDRYKGEIGFLLDRILDVWVSFLRGQFALMLIMGLLTWILNLLLGTPQAFLLGILAGLLEIVPSLGPLLATIPAAVLAVLLGSSIFTGLNPWIFMLIVIVGYVLLQAMENQVLVPKVLGGAVNLPSLVVLIGVTIAGAKAGIVGIFLATPVIATGKELLKYVSRKINQEPEVIQPPEEEKPSFAEQVRGFIGRFRLPLRRTKQDEVQQSRSQV